MLCSQREATNGRADVTNSTSSGSNETIIWKLKKVHLTPLTACFPSNIMLSCLQKGINKEKNPGLLVFVLHRSPVGVADVSASHCKCREMLEE